MDRCILDTSIIVKSIFKPPKSLSVDLYTREIETHENFSQLTHIMTKHDADAQERIANLRSQA